MKLPLWLGHSIAFIVSATAGFFLVLNVVFSDVFSLREQLTAISAVLGAYLILGFILSRLWQGHRRTWALWLIIPPGILMALLLISERAFDWFDASVLVGFVMGSLIGTGLLSLRRTPPPNSPPVGV